MKVYVPRAGLNQIVSLAALGLALGDAAPLVGGAIAKYTVGPDWTGAEFRTIQAAVDAAVADGHSGAVLGQTVQFEVYPQAYPDPVVIPETLPRFNFVGTGRNVGTRITGAFTLNLPAQNGTFSFDNFAFVGQLTIAQAVATNTITGYFWECSASLAPVVNATRLSVECNECFWTVGGTWNVREYISHGGRIGTSVVMTSVVQNVLYNTRLTGNVATATWVFTSPFNALLGAPQIAGRVTYNGAECNQIGCWHAYNGSPAVTDNCTAVSACQDNFFSHNSGPAGPAWVKTGASVFHDGGNSFGEGQQYPWYDLGTGTRTDRAESDNELRRVLTRSGSPVLTPAEVGSQRKTTIAKVDGGGVVTLPLASAVEPGCTIVVKDLNGSATASPFSVAGQGADLIDGAASFPVATNYSAVTFQQMSTTDWGVIGIYP